MRSSWEASATNWRTCVSERWRAARADSTCPSSVLRAPPTCPTSAEEPRSALSTRSSMLTSPRSSGWEATRCAVRATRSRGASAERTMVRPARATTRAPTRATASSMSSWVRMSPLSPSRDSPVMTVLPEASSRVATTR